MARLIQSLIIKHETWQAWQYINLIIKKNRKKHSIVVAFLKDCDKVKSLQMFHTCIWLNSFFYIFYKIWFIKERSFNFYSRCNWSVHLWFWCYLFCLFISIDSNRVFSLKKNCDKMIHILKRDHQQTDGFFLL